MKYRTIKDYGTVRAGTVGSIGESGLLEFITETNVIYHSPQFCDLYSDIFEKIENETVTPELNEPFVKIFKGPLTQLNKNELKDQLQQGLNQSVNFDQFIEFIWDKTQINLIKSFILGIVGNKLVGIWGDYKARHFNDETFINKIIDKVYSDFKEVE